MLAQLRGTDNLPTVPARPSAAVTGAAVIGVAVTRVAVTGVAALLKRSNIFPTFLPPSAAVMYVAGIVAIRTPNNGRLAISIALIDTWPAGAANGVRVDAAADAPA